MFGLCAQGRCDKCSLQSTPLMVEILPMSQKIDGNHIEVGQVFRRNTLGIAESLSCQLFNNSELLWLVRCAGY